MRKLFLFFAILMMSFGLLWAEDISVEATVDSNHLTIGEAGQLTLTIHGVKDGIEPPAWPKLDGIETSYLGPSTSISIINGQYSSVHAYNYSVFPSKTGHVQIPVVSLTIDGKQFTTQPIELNIADATKSQPTANDAGTTTDAPVSIKDKIFMVVSTPQANVYVGQKVPIRIKLYINQLPIRNLQFPKFEQDGFTMENFAQPPQYNEVVNGVNHTVVDYQTFLYPTRSGELKIGPMHLDGSLLYRSKGGPKGGNSFFNDDFFSGMFDSYQEHPITVNADALKINVLPLPSEERPENFTGAVGQMDFSATISPQEVHIGDPVTLKMKLSGVANYKSLHMPEFKDSRFKTYDPVVKDSENSRLVEQVIIPNQEDIHQVPAVEFNYFDPASGQYKVITQGPFSLKVIPIAQDQEFKAIGFADLSKGAVSPTGQVDYVQQFIVVPFKNLFSLTKKWQFWAVLIFVMALFVMGWYLGRFRDRLHKDTVFARRHGALKTAKQGIKTAQEYINTGKPKDFYHQVTKTMNNFIADKIHRPSAGLSISDIIHVLQEKKTSAIVIDNIRTLYENADLVQFATAQIDQPRMQADLVKVNEIIADLEKKL